MNEKILDTIKELLGSTDAYSAFDKQLIVHINSVLSAVCQLGAGPDVPFRLTTGNETWGEVIGNNPYIELIKDYVYIKTKLVFDPPQNSTILNALKEECKEIEWRLNVAVDPGWEKIEP